MSGFFQRIFSLGSAEAHSIIDQLEDPVKMTEQGIRELKKELDNATQSFAEVKASQIRAQRDMEKNKVESLDWERKAMALLQQGQSGMLSQEDSERLAAEALHKKDECFKRFDSAKKLNENQSQTVNTLQKGIDKIKSKVQQYENELTTLKARSKTAQATSKINKHLSSVDPKGTIEMLERMKQKVDEEETLALAYGDIANLNKSIDDEINDALLPDSTIGGSSQSSELEALKAKMGIK